VLFSERARRGQNLLLALEPLLNFIHFLLQQVREEQERMRPHPRDSHGFICGEAEPMAQFRVAGRLENGPKQPGFKLLQFLADSALFCNIARALDFNFKGRAVPRRLQCLFDNRVLFHITE